MIYGYNSNSFSIIDIKFSKLISSSIYLFENNEAILENIEGSDLESSEGAFL